MEEFTDRLDTVTEKLITKLEQAIEELDSYVVKSSKKEKKTEYDDDGKKPLCEEIVEREELHIEKAIVDRSALKQLVSAIMQLRGADTENEDGRIEVYLSKESEELSE